MKNYYITNFSKGLFWDVNILNMSDMDKYPLFIIQRVLEYGTMNDWKTILSYYGLNKIVNLCKQMRTLPPIACLLYTSPSPRD